MGKKIRSMEYNDSTSVDYGMGEKFIEIGS